MAALCVQGPQHGGEARSPVCLAWGYSDRSPWRRFQSLDWTSLWLPSGCGTEASSFSRGITGLLLRPYRSLGKPQKKPFHSPNDIDITLIYTSEHTTISYIIRWLSDHNDQMCHVFIIHGSDVKYFNYNLHEELKFSPCKDVTLT